MNIIVYIWRWAKSIAVPMGDERAIFNSSTRGGTRGRFTKVQGIAQNFLELTAMMCVYGYVNGFNKIPPINKDTTIKKIYDKNPLMPNYLRTRYQIPAQELIEEILSVFDSLARWLSN